MNFSEGEALWKGKSERENFGNAGWLIFSDMKCRYGLPAKRVEKSPKAGGFWGFEY